MCAARDPLAHLRQELRILRQDVGSPTGEELETLADLQGARLSTSTSHNVLNRPGLTRWQTIETFITACEQHAKAARLNIDAARFDLSAWKAKYDAAVKASKEAAAARPSYYATVVEAFRADHADANWDDTVADLLAAFTREPGFHVVVGDPYAGKTALMTKLHEELENQHIPAIIFYIVQNEADRPVHFLPAVIKQLLALLTARDAGYAAVMLEHTHNQQLVQFDRLWREFAAGPEPVFLLIDGLDERAVESAGGGLAKIIPMSAGVNGQIVLTTRPNPTLDLPRAHPLTRQLDTATYTLNPSSRARADRELVERELGAFLRAEDPCHRDLAGLIAIAGSAVSDREVAELLELAGPGAAATLREPIARSLFVEHAPDGTPRFRFAHQQIRAFVETELGRDGAKDTMIARVLAWADQYAASGWSDNTPGFLREHLPTFVASRVPRGQRSRRLTALLSDSYRRVLWMVAGNDRLFLQLSELARQTLDADTGLGDNPVDAFLVEAWSAEAAAFNRVSPPDHLAALARVGLHEQALDGALLYTDEESQWEALSAIVAALHEEGAHTALHSVWQAILATATGLDLGSRAYAVKTLVRTALAIGDPAAAHAALEAVADNTRQDAAYHAAIDVTSPIAAQVAIDFAHTELDGTFATIFLLKQLRLHLDAGSANDELDLILAAVPPDPQRQSLYDIRIRARQAASAGEALSTCLAMFDDIPPRYRSREIVGLAEFLLTLSTEDAVLAAERACAEAEALDPAEPRFVDICPKVMSAAGKVFAHAGRVDYAERMVRKLGRGSDHFEEVIVAIGCELARGGWVDEALLYVKQHSPNSFFTLPIVAGAAAECGRLTAALDIAAHAAYRREDAHLKIVEALCRTSDYENARTVALSMTLATPDWARPWLCKIWSVLCKDLAAIGQRDLAQRAADHLIHHGSTVERLMVGVWLNKPTRSVEDPHDVVACARQGNLSACATVTPQEADTILHACRTAFDAASQHHDDRPDSTIERLDAVIAASTAGAAIAGLLLAEAFHAEPHVSAYRVCAAHLANHLLRMPVPSTPGDGYRHRYYVDGRTYTDSRPLFRDYDVVLAYSSLALLKGTEVTFAQIAGLNDRRLLDVVLRRTSRSLAVCRDTPELTKLAELAMSHPRTQDEHDWDFLLANLADIMIRAGHPDAALHLTTAIEDAGTRADALSEILPTFAASQYKTMWDHAGQFVDPLHELRAIAKAVATVLPTDEWAYRHSIRRMIDAVRAIPDADARGSGLAYLAIALMPAFPECVDHFLNHPAAQTTTPPSA